MSLDTTESAFYESTMVAVLYLVHYDTLLQNLANIVTKCNGYLIIKSNKSLLQQVSGTSLQTETDLL